ncbi:hypothetical protein, partial [Streptomyces sp. SID2999]|uniref:hypothetical protein n=1 Tax=Streptomyces sp. SID2999 TaxID=2690258 RepID=UPI001F1BA84F
MRTERITASAGRVRWRGGQPQRVEDWAGYVVPRPGEHLRDRLPRGPLAVRHGRLGGRGVEPPCLRLHGGG